MPGFAIALLLGVAALTLFAYVVDKGPDVGLGGFAEAILSTATGTGVAIAVTFALLVFIAWCLRQIVFERLATRPGHVEVADFRRPARLTDVEAGELSARFRQRLAVLRLQSPAPVPGSQPHAAFIEVLGRGAPSPSNPIGIVISLLQAAKPDHAYEITGVLTEREGPKPCGVTFQVVRLPGQAARPDTVYDSTWERAVERAADRATAHILPQTRRCSTPWASWRGFIMPPDLLAAYEYAVELELQRRFDEALDSYYAAVREDPLNLALRLHIGLLQEKLGLYLDAMWTYEGMNKVTAPGDDELPTGFYKRAARAENDAALLVGRYRRAVLLGGDVLAWQWRKRGHPEHTHRDQERTSLRDRLAVQLVNLIEKVEREGARSSGPAGQVEKWFATRRRGGNTTKDVLDRLVHNPSPGRDREYYELRELFSLIALCEVPSLHRCIGSLRRRAGYRDVAPVSKKSLDLTAICIKERLLWVRAQMNGVDDSKRWIWKRPEELIGTVDGVGDLRRWHEHYNAACALSLPLLVDQDSPDEDAPRDRLAAAAVRHLEQATATADSAYVASRRDWIVSEDPDLKGLRRHPRFKAFEALYLPAGRTTPRRPSNGHRLEASRYTRDLLQASARRWQQIWHGRRCKGTELPSVPELVRWWQDEASIWAHVGDVALNHRHWRDRLDLLKDVNARLQSYGKSPLAVAFPRYEDEPLTTAPEEDPQRHATATIAAADERLGELDAVLQQGSGAPGARGVKEWIAHLREIDAEGSAPDPSTVAQLCGSHAALWAALDNWCSADPDDRAAPRDSFRRERDRLESLLAGATSRVDEPRNGQNGVLAAGKELLKRLRSGHDRREEEPPAPWLRASEGVAPARRGSFGRVR